MNKEQYTNWIKNADLSASVSVTSEVQQYPYCMLFHLIRSMKIDTAENRAKLAVLHPNRRRLQAILMQQKPVNEGVARTKTVKNDKKEKENSVKNAATELRDKEDLMEILQKRLAELKHTSNVKAEENLDEPIYEPQPSVSLDELVEKFNKFPPKIVIDAENFDIEKQYKDLGKSSMYERTNIVSETLAELYASQGAYDKAVKIYEALKLKYPEKSSTFAAIIKSINENKK